MIDVHFAPKGASRHFEVTLAINISLLTERGGLRDLSLYRL